MEQATTVLVKVLRPKRSAKARAKHANPQGVDTDIVPSRPLFAYSLAPGPHISRPPKGWKSNCSLRPLEAPDPVTLARTASTAHVPM